MARPHISVRLKRLWVAYRKRQKAGFTLIELLVAMFIGSLITLSLMTLVVQLVNVNQRDTSRSETQRDMQAAMNYITQELREAVFVYDGNCLKGTATITAANVSTECPGVVNYIPAGLSTASPGKTPIPVLAFWRTDPLPQGLLTACKNNAGNLADTTLPVAVQNVPCLSGRSYTLVVYVLVDDSSTTDIWQGRARLVRYQLTQFKSNATTGTDTNIGYVAPLSAPNSTFQQWPFQATTDANNVTTVANGQTAAPPGTDLDAVILTGSAAVLVDYVDDVLVPPVTPSCPIDSSLTLPNLLRNVTPSNPPNNIRSFYACVRGNIYQRNIANAVTTEQGVNQEVQVFLVGNVEGRPGFPPTLSSGVEGLSFPLQTRVLTRGIINKSPK